MIYIYICDLHINPRVDCPCLNTIYVVKPSYETSILTCVFIAGFNNQRVIRIHPGVHVLLAREVHCRTAIVMNPSIH